MEEILDRVSQTTFCYAIDDIANWQKEISTATTACKISLPSLQRGFVWKASQIESLWDSLLRGYPIGALLMNKVADNKKELLDGQQRSTSISIGYLNPFNKNAPTQLLNIQKNIPSVWIDLKPMQNSVHGLKFGVRVLTRSHPWGYQLNDNRKPLSTSEREQALNFFREKAKDAKISFSKLTPSQINPWDAHYPIPLSVLLSTNLNSFEVWSRNIHLFIEDHLTEIKTKYSGDAFVDYTNIEAFLEELYKVVLRAKQVLIPEILVTKDILEEKEEHEMDDSDDATLFVRLNSEGTRITGEELIYSLLKSTFPEAKELVEKIDVKYIAPSKIVNLFARLSLMEAQNFERYQNDMNLIGFRRNFANQEFKDILREFIQEGDNTNSEAKILFDKALAIVSLNKDLPKVYVKHQINSSLNLFFVLMVFLYKNEEISDELMNKIYKDFHAIALFNSDSKKVATRLFDVLKQNNFKNWEESVMQLKQEYSSLVLPLIGIENFKKITNLILDNYIKNRKYRFDNWDYIREIFKENKESINFLMLNYIQKKDEQDAEFENRTLDEAVNYWLKFSYKIYWDKTFLILAQKEYFNQEFEEFMEFDGIEDTNRPWDWDHIYPSSWVYSKKGISSLARQVINTNGNFRALSFNENRSQSNHESPKVRFENNSHAQQGSFVKENDLKYWLQLSNTESRLKESNDSKEKVNAFVYACFHRMNNIYEEVYSLFQH
ncbi:DUF262 domain-containing protein [Flavobacterium petrolei]|uniref:DUF262 domain-containing protein n=1 Tax=Flavobacterium petrolei TaxID=2259594 RepID=UPI0037569950